MYDLTVFTLSSASSFTWFYNTIAFSSNSCNCGCWCRSLLPDNLISLPGFSAAQQSCNNLAQHLAKHFLKHPITNCLPFNCDKTRKWLLCFVQYHSALLLATKQKHTVNVTLKYCHQQKALSCCSQAQPIDSLVQLPSTSLQVLFPMDTSVMSQNIPFSVVPG